MAAESQDYNETDHVRWLGTATRYLTAAKVLVDTQDYASSRMVHLPALHLTAHGIELLLKANLIGAGWTVDDVRKRFGHFLLPLWRAQENEKLRIETRCAARLVHEEAAASARWACEFSGDPGLLLEEAIERLAPLHSSETYFALRYPGDPQLVGPRVPFLAFAFWRVAELGRDQPRLMLPD
ncbi:hypothetical protein [Ancylobacter defluvii]|uniref:Uncharacterized protein n=1 Tax=Ancylobacter defluvii TaxID=1282440 RepID=A0A9W6NAV6_9HYPH|nr:hypothetical protein [Ancylobacter defluvii]MBS7588745.1 hypothetical protein [Ancylobacter defluvii]GLK84028.1 hypothetical protein GCM10017653_20980 [Ancylobacter defluvii]